MGTVWVDGVQVGTFTPDIVGTTGNVLVGAIDVGDFELDYTGYVYLNGTVIGTYTASGAEPPVGVTDDPRARTKIYLDTYLSPSKLTNDVGEPVAYAVIYENPEYLIEHEFQASSNPVDLLFVIGKPTSELELGVRYTEHMPIRVCTINKSGITGTLLAWKGENELRRVLGASPFGSIRLMERIEDSDTQLGSAVLYSTLFMLDYRRTSLVGQA